MRWLVAAAIGLPLVIMVAIGIVSWRATWAEAERELGRSADAVAQYVLRVFDGHRVGADRVNDLLENLTNEQIQSREQELHLKLARLLPGLPLVQTIAVSRPDGLGGMVERKWEIDGLTLVARIPMAHVQRPIAEDA